MCGLTLCFPGSVVPCRSSGAPAYATLTFWQENFATSGRDVHDNVVSLLYTSSKLLTSENVVYCKMHFFLDKVSGRSIEFRVKSLK